MKNESLDDICQVPIGDHWQHIGTAVFEYHPHLSLQLNVFGDVSLQNPALASADTFDYVEQLAPSMQHLIQHGVQKPHHNS